MQIEQLTFTQIIKRPIARFVGRERANRISAPYYDWLANRRTRKFLKTLTQQNLFVNLGCGYRPLPGWVNVDLARGPQVQVVWDLRHGLPFESNSCEAILAEHVIEHVSKSDAQKLLNECYRVLQPGAVLRISTPDAERFLRAYLINGEFLNHPYFTRPIDAPIDRINEMMGEEGHHLWTYDAMLLSIMLNRSGFVTVVQQHFGESLHPRMNGIDSELRAIESLYMEAVR